MKILIFLAAMSLPFLAYADSVFVEESQSMNRGSQVDEAKQTLNQLVKSELSSSGHRLVDSSEQAQWILKPNLLKLGSSYIVTLSKKRNGSVVYSQKLKASGLEDLDTVSERLVRAVMRDKSVESTQQVNSVTKEEQAGTTLQTEVTRQFYFGFGPGKVSNVESNEAGFNWTVGYLWGLDHNFSLRLGLQGTSAEGDASMTSLGVGGQYYLNLDKHSPYLLGMVGYSWTEANAEELNCILFCGISENGWSTEIGGGMHFFRTAKVNLAVEVAYTHGYYDILNDNPGVFNGRILVLW